MEPIARPHAHDCGKQPDAISSSPVSQGFGPSFWHRFGFGSLYAQKEEQRRIAIETLTKRPPREVKKLYGA
jgi:hypothetical protein